MIIEPSHFEYLAIQRGEVAHEKKDFARWKQAYEDSLGTIFAHVKPILPDRCRNIVDIGSGLGGIDIMLAWHYGDGLEGIYMVDGLDDPPVVKSSFKTFNNANVARDFHEKNKVDRSLTVQRMDRIDCNRIDLVVSFAAYGFHIHPGDYLLDLQRIVHDKTVLIFDVRRTKDLWLADLVSAFGPPKVLHRAEKYVRLAFRA